MNFIIGFIIGFLCLYYFAKYISKRQAKYVERQCVKNVKLSSSNDAVYFVKEILEQIERHRDLGCSSYIFEAPNNIALHPVFYYFINDYKYNVLETDNGFKFEIEL